MELSSVSNSSFARTVTPSRSSSDRQSNDNTQADIAESKAQERAQQQRAVQQRLQQNKTDTQRRLDGRIISFGHEKDDISSQQNQASYNRSRVNEAYSRANNEAVNSHNENTQRSQEREPEAIDIVV